MVRICQQGIFLSPCEEMPPGVYRDLFVEACLRLCGKRSMDYNDVNEKQPQVPQGASIPRNQVAGHKHEGRSKLGLLEHEDGTILKALQKAPRGTRELDFYRKIYDDDNCTDKEILQLRNFMPSFFGKHHFPEYENVTYIKLENLVGRFRRPCVVDIKMGKKTYDPEAGPAKIAKEMTKFPHVEKFGFQFTGFQTYDPVEQKMKFYDKFYCRGLGEDELLSKGLGTYFGVKHGLRKDAISLLLNKLYEIERWFKSQRKFAFYASSLLMIYEGDPSPPTSDFYSSYKPCQNSSDYGSAESDSDHTNLTDNASSGVTDTDTSDLASSDTISLHVDSASSTTSGVENSTSSLTPSLSSVSVDTQATSSNGVPCADNSLVDIRMIDFTHVFNVTEQDDNYLYGLQNLIGDMEELMRKVS